MATYTPNLNLKKPDGTEDIDVNDINGNSDKIDTGVANIMTSITNLQTSINKKTWWTLLNYETVSTATVFETYNNRKISDYSGGLLLLSWWHEWLIRGTTIIPMTEFINGREIDVYHINPSGERKWLAITRISDTSIRVNTNETGGTTKAFVCAIFAN